MPCPQRGTCSLSIEKRGTNHRETRTRDQDQYGYGSKVDTQNGTLGSGKVDSKPAVPGCNLLCLIPALPPKHLHVHVQHTICSLHPSPTTSYFLHPNLRTYNLPQASYKLQLTTQTPTTYNLCPRTKQRTRRGPSHLHDVIGLLCDARRFLWWLLYLTMAGRSSEPCLGGETTNGCGSKIRKPQNGTLVNGTKTRGPLVA